jgi:hypothetical protein
MNQGRRKMFDDTDNVLKDHTIASFETPTDSEEFVEISELMNDDPSQELNALEKLANRPKELLTKEVPEGFTETERPQKRSPSEKRVKQALYNAKIAKERELQMAGELAETKRLLAEKENLLAKKDELVNTYYDANSATREASIKNALRQAKLDGDIDAEIELSDQLATLKAEKMTNEYHKYQKTTAPVYQQAQQNSDYIDQPLPNSSEDFEFDNLDDPIVDWQQENAFLFTNPRLSQKFLDQVAYYEDALTLNGEIANVDPIEILNQAKSDLESLYNVKNKTKSNPFNEQPQTHALPNELRNTPPSNYQNRSNVAPVPRAGSMAEQYAAATGGGNRITLTAEQRQMINEIERQMPHKSRDQIVSMFAQNLRDAKNLNNPFNVKFRVEDY